MQISKKTYKNPQKNPQKILAKYQNNLQKTTQNLLFTAKPNPIKNKVKKCYLKKIKKNMQVSLQNLPIQPKSEQKKRSFEVQLELRNLPSIHYSMPKYSQIGKSYKKNQTNSK